MKKKQRTVHVSLHIIRSSFVCIQTNKNTTGLRVEPARYILAALFSPQHRNSTDLRVLLGLTVYEYSYCTLLYCLEPGGVDLLYE